jgi:hypothetical protein
MTLEDVPFVVGPVFGPVIALAVLVAVVAMRRSAIVIALGSVLAFASMVSFVAYWWVWGIGFNDADAGRTVSSDVVWISNATVATSATASVLLLVLATSSFVGRGARQARNQPA